MCASGVSAGGRVMGRSVWGAGEGRQVLQDDWSAQLAPEGTQPVLNEGMLGLPGGRHCLLSLCLAVSQACLTATAS